MELIADNYHMDKVTTYDFKMMCMQTFWGDEMFNYLLSPWCDPRDINLLQELAGGLEITCIEFLKTNIIGEIDQQKENNDEVSV